MTEKTDANQVPWRFQPGQSGNPAGKPKGARNAAILVLDAIGEEGAAAALRAVVLAAAGGDMRAAEILLRRVWPERKGRPVTLPLRALNSAADIATALASVAQSVAAGDITPEEGCAVAGVLELQRRAIETAVLEARLTIIENQMEIEK